MAEEGTVLFVNNGHLNTKNAIDLIRQLGCDIEHFPDGPALEKRLAAFSTRRIKDTGPVAVLLSDLDITERYSRIEDYWGIPFIVYSVNEGRSREEAMDCGAFCYLGDTFNHMDILSFLREALTYSRTFSDSYSESSATV